MSKHEYYNSFKTKMRNMASLSVYSTGYEQQYKGQVIGPEKRKFYYIINVITGNGIYLANGKRYNIREGETYVTCPDTNMEQRADNQKPWKRCWVGFNGTDARLLLDAAGFNPNMPVINNQSPKKIRRLIMDIYRNRGKKPHEMIAMTARLYTLLSCLMEDAAIVQEFQAGRSGIVHIQQACDFIANHYHEPITVDEIAANVSLSRSQLYRIFMEHVSMSPNQYIKEFRMREACTLMQKKTDSIKEIAFAVGIENPLYFSSCFKRYTGQTPTEYLEANEFTNKKKVKSQSLSLKKITLYGCLRRSAEGGM